MHYDLPKYLMLWLNVPRQNITYDQQEHVYREQQEMWHEIRNRSIYADQMLAFSMSAHPRLARDSLSKQFSEDVMRKINESLHLH